MAKQGGVGLDIILLFSILLFRDVCLILCCCAMFLFDHLNNGDNKTYIYSGGTTEKVVFIEDNLHYACE